MLTLVSCITWSGLSDAALSRHFAGVAEMAKGQRDRTLAEEFIALAYMMAGVHYEGGEVLGEAA